MRFLKMFDMQGKVVVVTGASGQLGDEICGTFNDAGAIVIGIDKKISGRRHRGVNYQRADIRRKKDLLSIFASIAAEYKSLDVLINNAGVSVFEPFMDRREKDLDFVMDVNLKGTFFAIQNYVDIFDRYKFKRGSIINIASIYGVISPDPRIYTDCKRHNSEVYGATKAGIVQMTKYFAVHLAGRNIRVNSVSPGGIFNPKHPQGKSFIKNYSFRCPMKRMAEASEITGALVYLASGASSYTTGQNIIIDGGMSAW